MGNISDMALNNRMFNYCTRINQRQRNFHEVQSNMGKIKKWDKEKDTDDIVEGKKEKPDRSERNRDAIDDFLW